MYENIPVDTGRDLNVHKTRINAIFKFLKEFCNIEIKKTSSEWLFYIYMQFLLNIRNLREVFNSREET